jgi:hypothetical protein
MADKSAVIVVGDLHINSKVALSPPRVQLDEGGSYHSSRGQRWLWRSWNDFWDQVKDDTKGYRRIVVFNGDMGELDINRRSYQLITPNKATITGMVLDTLEPAIALADLIYVIRGTQAHTGKSAWLEEDIAQDLDNAVHDGGASWWHLRAVASGVKFDICHHASMGGLPWTEKNAANKIAKIVVDRYMIDMEQKPPDITIRSHNHRWNDSADNFKTRAICLPCWSMMTEYGYRIGKENSIADVGGAVVFCEDGEYTVKKYKYIPPESRRVWRKKM